MVEAVQDVPDGPTTLQELLSTRSKNAQPFLSSTPSTQSYLTHLTSLPLSTLLTEPGRLATESDLLASDLTQLCHNQYTTFLSLHSASNTLSNSLDDLTASLDSILDDGIPTLEQEARNFTQLSQSIQKERQRASLVLENHDKLLDVLELPHLLATCVQNGYYAEALDLAAHFERNILTVLPDIALLQSVHTSVLGSVQALLNQLLHQLRSPAKLPVLFKTVNLLRRMDVLSEEQLAVAFIQGRTVYLEEAFAHASGTERDKAEDPARYLRKWVEVFREGVYDVVTQYSSIFLSPPSLSSNHNNNNNSNIPSTSSPKAPLSSLRILITTFSNDFLERLLDLLRSSMPDIPVTDMSSLSSLITQLSYCSSSFARVGLDFRATLQPIIEDSVLEIVSRGYDETSETLSKGIADAKRGNKKPSQWLVSPDFSPNSADTLQRHQRGRSGSSSTSTATVTALHIPPIHFASYPPLAIFINGILQTLNSLRLVPPPSLLPRVVEVQTRTIVAASEALLAFCRSRRWADGNGEMNTAAATAEVAVLVAFGRALWDGENGAAQYLLNALVIGLYGRAAPFPLGESAALWKDAKQGWADYLEELGVSLEVHAKDSTDPSSSDAAEHVSMDS